MPLILLVDDDHHLVELLSDALRGYQVVFASDGVAALHQLRAEKPDLVLVDLGMPGMDGAILLSKIRLLSRVPMIVLSARHEQSDVVGALKLADDFIAKPFDLDDLEARIEAVLRRCPCVSKLPGVYTVGSLVMSATGLATVNGHPFHLTLTEHKLLLRLAEREGEVVTRDQLASEALGWFPGDESRSLDTHIGRIRQRLHRHSSAPTLATIRGYGFVLRGGDQS